MKPRVKFCFEDSDNSQKIDFELCEVEQIDAIIEGLEEARAELEHQIEMEKQRKREKRKRAKMRRTMRSYDWIKSQEKELNDKLNDFAEYLNIHGYMEVPKINFRKVIDDDKYDVFTKTLDSNHEEVKKMFEDMQKRNEDFYKEKGKNLYHVYEYKMENFIPVVADYFKRNSEGTVINFYAEDKIVASFPNCCIVKLMHTLKENND